MKEHKGCRSSFKNQCEECKGCRSSFKNQCIVSPYLTNEDNTIIKCPCMICLVKGICSFPCKEYNDYYYMNISRFNMKDKLWISSIKDF